MRKEYSLDEYYFNYSPNQERFLRKNGMKPVEKRINNNSGRAFYIYEITPEFEKLLKEWTHRGKTNQRVYKD